MLCLVRGHECQSVSWPTWHTLLDCVIDDFPSSGSKYEEKACGLQNSSKMRCCGKCNSQVGQWRYHEYLCPCSEIASPKRNGENCHRFENNYVFWTCFIRQYFNWTCTNSNTLGDTKLPKTICTTTCTVRNCTFSNRWCETIKARIDCIH